MRSASPRSFAYPLVPLNTTAPVAVVGASGPTGIHLARLLIAQSRTVRVVARDEARLRRVFAGLPVDVRAVDVGTAEGAARAVDGCALVFDCVGLPSAQMDRHPVVARALAGALRTSEARCVQVSSYWSLLPVRRLPVDETHPREGGPPWVQWRREAEDILLAAGACVIQLPDFFGPEVHASTWQRALAQALRGKPMDTIAAADVERDGIYVPDAMRVALEIAEKPAAFGERWIVPGSGPMSARALADLCGEVLGRRVRVRSAGPAMLWIASRFDRELRAFLPMVPLYSQPIAFDGTKLASLIGEPRRTPWPEAVRATLDWLRGQRAD